MNIHGKLKMRNTKLIKETKKNKKTGGEFRCTGEDLAVYDPQLSS